MSRRDSMLSSVPVVMASTIIRQLLAAAIAVTAVAAVPASFAAGLKPGDTVEGTIRGLKLDGVVLGCNPLQAQILGRDGRLWLLAPNQTSELTKTGMPFRPYSSLVMRDALQREIGRDYEVSGAGQFSVTYLLIHPQGQRDKWIEHLDELYRAFVHYFSIRGFKLNSPPFPLVGFVCKDRKEFERLASTQMGLPTGKGGKGVVGYYSQMSNRITLYDMGDHGGNWTQNASVLIHEATHQTAFNTGIHNRYSPPPVWVAEGLATMFEAPGVYDSQNHPGVADRVNRSRLHDFKRSVERRHTPKVISSIIATDELFRLNPAAAYAEAWALTYYLVETQPRQYAEYLKRTASHPLFHRSTAAERTADFTAVFGSDWPMIEARFRHFMAELP